MPVQIDMDMPSSCRFCPLTWERSGRAFCCLTIEPTDDRSYRAENCPLKEIK